MRLAIIGDAQGPTPMEGGHGLGRVVYNLAESLIARGHDVTLFGVTGSHCSGRTITPVSSGGLDLETVLAHAVMQEHRRQPFDAIYDHGHQHVLSSLFPRLPVVNHFNDKWQTYRPCAVVSSNGQRDIMAAEDTRFARARVMHNAHDARQFVPSYRADDNPEYLVYCGALIWYKQPLLAIEAAARMRVRLVMMGNITGGHGWLTREPTFTSVQVVGPKSGQERDDIIRGAVALLQLGHSEAGPLINIESGLLGTPVVAWPTGGNLDFIKDCENGVFINLKIEDSVDAVIDGVNRARGIPRKLVRESTTPYWGNLDRIGVEAERHLMDVAEGARW